MATNVLVVLLVVIIVIEKPCKFPVEDGRQIVTMDLPEKIKISELEKGLVYEFVFEQHKAPFLIKILRKNQ